MSRLSDKKLALLQSDYGSSLWYITKQNCSFRDLMMMASILERWNDDPNESFEAFFNRVKTEARYTNYIGNSPHRALKNCEFYGIMSPSTSLKAAYTSNNLTDVYYTVKSLCNEDFAETNKYQYIIDKQIENMNITIDGNDLKPVLFTLKVMLVVGDATGNYELSLQEFKLFICTAKEWCQYFESAESILRSREDSEYLSAALESYDIANDTRFNLVLKNLSYVESTTKSIVIAEDKIEEVRKKVAEFEVGEIFEKKEKHFWVNTFDRFIESSVQNYLTAIRTKPFILLAGISGTGKSRIVRELAFMTCPKELQDEDGTTPGNYCMIEVKPNWHDSSELLGYYSSFNGGGYRFTKFDRFVVKAWLNPDVPFFVCLDEMNLAPVEQYFAEFLSVLETRSRDKEGNVVTGALVDKQYFKDDTKMTTELGLDKGDDWTIKVRSDLINKGLTLPPNLIVIGTVNMDDTTYQFSRKVIDRAMTIEMNGGELSQMFGNSNSLKYRSDEDVVKLGMFKAPYINADEVIERYKSQAQIIKEKLPEKLEAVNTALKDTPFQISYRVLNELVIYLGTLMDEATAKGETIDDDALPALIDQAMDQITLMKILPRIEGDEDMFRRSGGTNVLKTLQSLFSEDSDSYRKLKEMADRLDRTGFTRFWP